MLGIELLPWQKWLLIHALELNPDGTFRYRKIILLVGRQNGKSTLLQVLSLWRIYANGCNLVIGTAQNLDVAEEVWSGAVEMAEEVPELAAEIAQVLKVNGKKQLKLHTGERYKVAAASRRGGRGLSGELVLLDELREHQSWDAWAAVTKTTNARLYAQIWGVSNAGDASSLVLRYLRKMAHKALGDPDGICDDDDPDITDDPAEEIEDDLDDDSLGVFEWSAPPGCSITNRDGWAQANPALGYLIHERTLASDAKTDPEWVFRTEVLCQWSDGSLEGPFPPGSWGDCLDENSEVADPAVTLCVDVSWDRGRTHIGLAGFRADGLPTVEVIASRAGTEWAVPWLTSPDRSLSVQEAPVVVQASGAPASSLIEPMRAAGLDVVEIKGADLGKATGTFYDRVRAGTVRHRVQPILDVAAATAVTKPTADSYLWDRKNSPHDAAPLIAVTYALYELLNAPPPEPPAPPPVVTTTTTVRSETGDLMTAGF